MQYKLFRRIFKRIKELKLKLSGRNANKTKLIIIIGLIQLITFIKKIIISCFIKHRLKFFTSK